MSQLDMQAKPEEMHQGTCAENSPERLGNKQDAEARKAALTARIKAYQVKPGEVRNPHGRPKKDFDLAKQAQKHAEKAINTLVKAMTDEEAPWPVRTNAAGMLLDRGFGRAPQSIQIDAKVDFGAEFEAFVRQLSTKATEKVIEAEVIEAEDAEYEALPAPDDRRNVDEDSA